MSCTSPIDVRHMAIVHGTFSRAFDESAQLVRSVPVPSGSRVAFLADHVDFVLAMLHVHHEGEDELLYPKLIERRPELALMLQEVESGHELIAKALQHAQAACSTWRRAPSADSGEALAGALEELNAVCRPHLDEEEQRVVPLAAETLTQHEWDALGGHAVAHTGRRWRGITFGMILESLGDTDRAAMMKALPPPVRVLFPLLIARPWRRYAFALRAGS